ncbi:NADH dehydrogenase [ubiquinone] 1 beta subcomplex subunit 11, mitochondrial-like [Ruditapes philippinarum]|uniref:NADH dehydrogenase [ubiquinone] 1 beta subcomplex subunit 11, mitochondrial-like n=1 Tax=Ruditapes philippinarum TaxID=129788 RepID=UPI00295ACF17|nr:NADH dehydrogenase [ubiquinone] 1 beta subcomplex subunit 11, mitochondrial-like [Ruditapes philippinarum]
MATLQRLARPCRQILKNYARNRVPMNSCRMITTSGKNKDIASTGNESLVEKSQELKDLEEHFGDANPERLKNWVPYGWHLSDRENDTFNMNLVNFAMFTITIVFGAVYIAYEPDTRLREWSAREAFLELDRREKAGLPLVDPYLIPPEQIELPSEEEIGDTEIII